MELIEALNYKEKISYIRTLVQNGSNVNAEDYEGRTALIIASGGKYKIAANIQAIRLLIENGANVNAVMRRNSTTALIAASGWSNHANIYAIKLLIENGSYVNAVDIYGATPLMYSAGIQIASMANIQAFKFLLENGADINIVNSLGCTVCTYLHNTPNAQIFQLVINRHYRKQNLIFTAAIKNSTTVTKMGKFAKISSGPRQDWEMHINSFLSLDIEKNA